MNACFIGIGSMGGTQVRALATESHGNLGGTTSRLRLFNGADAEHRVLRSFFTAAGLAMGREFNFPSPQSKEGKKHLILFSRLYGKLRESCRRGNVTTRLCEANHGSIAPRIADRPLARASIWSCSTFCLRGARGVASPGALPLPRRGRSGFLGCHCR